MEKLNLNVKKKLDTFFNWIKGAELIELQSCDVSEDPVRPELDIKFRTKYGRKIYGVKYKKEICAIMCFGFTDDIPKTVKNERYEEIMILQQSINYQKNKDRVGNKEKIIIDVAKDEGWSLGRSFRDAPEVDNYVKIGKKLDVGSMHNIEITKAHEYDVEGVVVEGDRYIKELSRIVVGCK